MSNPIITEPETMTPQRKPWVARHWVPIAGIATALVLGIGIGGAATPAPAAAKPLPAKTVEVEVEVTDETCKKVALELFDQLSTLNGDVVMPLLSAGKTMNEQFLLVVNSNVLAMDIDAVSGATAEMRGANGTLDSLTARIEAIGPDYTSCVG